MKRDILPICLLTLLITGCHAPGTGYFSGIVEYEYRYSSPTLDLDSLRMARPLKGIFRYDTSAYQSRFLGKDTITYYYSGLYNQCLSRSGSSDLFSCEDYSKTTDSVTYTREYPVPDSILGYPCRVLEIGKTNSTVLYYFTPEIWIAPATYRLHRSYNWDVYGTRTGGGMILKLEHRFKSFTMEGRALSIEEKEPGFRALEITDDLFDRYCKR